MKLVPAAIGQLLSGHPHTIVRDFSGDLGNAHMQSTCLQIPTTNQDNSKSVLVEKIQAALQDVHRYKQLVKCQGTNAQRLLDVFQWLLDTPELDSTFRRGLIVATQRISTKSGLYPVCYELKNVVQDGQHPVTAGGFADIYKGDFQGQPVCIKAIRVYQDTEVEHILKQFSKEAILWSQLRHRNVIPIYGLYRFRNQLCLVSPWMEHGDIARYLKKNPKAPRRQLADDIAQGLQYLHESGIIHGDLKGPNILIDDAGRACVTDFGISSISDPDILAWTSHSSAASKGGSVRWQAPELFDMENDELVKNSITSDVYAWACVCYEIFTGNVPFVNVPREPAVMLQIKLGNRPARPAEASSSWREWGLTETIWSLIVDCWRENPTERPTITQAIARLQPELSQDERSSVGESIISAARFRQKISEPVDTLTMSTVENLLEATEGLNITTQSAIHVPDLLQSDGLQSLLSKSPNAMIDTQTPTGIEPGHDLLGPGYTNTPSSSNTIYPSHLEALSNSYNQNAVEEQDNDHGDASPSVSPNPFGRSMRQADDLMSEFDHHMSEFDPLSHAMILPPVLPWSSSFSETQSSREMLPPLSSLIDWKQPYHHQTASPSGTPTSLGRNSNGSTTREDEGFTTPVTMKFEPGYATSLTTTTAALGKAEVKQHIHNSSKRPASEVLESDRKRRAILDT